MKKVSTYKFITALLVCLAIAVMVPQLASAAGTASGTSIGNTATAVYSVGSVTQPQVSTGPTATFVVSTKVIFSLAKADAGPVTVAPGDNTSGTARRLQYVLSNTSNKAIRFQVAAANLASALTITFGATPYTDNQNVNSFITACFDLNSNNVCDAGETFNTIASDSTYTVIVTGDIPVGASNNDIIGALVTATAVDAGGAPLQETAVPLINAENIVLADGAGPYGDDAARSGTYTDRDAWRVSAALLTITKAAAVYSDPLNGTTNPKAIPGAVITYTITVANAAGGATATNISVSDSLAAEIAAGHVLFNTAFNDGVNNCGAGNGIVVGGVCKTNTGDADGADWSVTAANTVTATGLTLAANSNVVIKFQVLIQ